MKCRDCEYFHIRQEPLRTPGTLWDLGLAECKKYNLVVDFATHGKLDKLECVKPDLKVDTAKKPYPLGLSHYSETIQALLDMCEDINPEEIKSHDTEESLKGWCEAWKTEMKRLINAVKEGED